MAVAVVRQIANAGCGTSLGQGHKPLAPEGAPAGTCPTSPRMGPTTSGYQKAPFIERGSFSLRPQLLQNSRISRVDRLNQLGRSIQAAPASVRPLANWGSYSKRAVLHAKPFIKKGSPKICLKKGDSKQSRGYASFIKKEILFDKPRICYQQ